MRASTWQYLFSQYYKLFCLLICYYKYSIHVKSSFKHCSIPQHFILIFNCGRREKRRYEELLSEFFNNKLTRCIKSWTKNKAMFLLFVPPIVVYVILGLLVFHVHLCTLKNKVQLTLLWVWQITSNVTLHKNTWRQDTGRVTYNAAGSSYIHDSNCPVPLLVPISKNVLLPALQVSLRSKCF